MAIAESQNAVAKAVNEPAIHHTIISHAINDPTVNGVGHVSATGAVLLAWVGILTPVLTAIATFLAIVWYLVVLYESDTFKRMRADMKNWPRHLKRYLYWTDDGKDPEDEPGPKSDK